MKQIVKKVLALLQYHGIGVEAFAKELLQSQTAKAREDTTQKNLKNK